MTEKLSVATNRTVKQSLVVDYLDDSCSVQEEVGLCLR